MTEIPPSDDSAVLSTPEASPLRRIAPLWHTAVVILPVATFSVLGTFNARRGSLKQHHLASYAVTVVAEWLLAAWTIFGLKLNGNSLRTVLGERRSGWRNWAADGMIALCFWIISITILGIVSGLFNLAHIANTQQKRAAELAPSSLAEIFLWVVLSITAGFCEEIVFRGYLQKQFAALGGSSWIGIAASALCFGFAHGYEGVSGIVLITLYGAMFGVLAQVRNSLRAGMMAHAWHDGLAGITLAVLKRVHTI